MSCFKLPNYKQKLPPQWTLLCQKIKTSMGEWLVEYNGENRPIKFTQGTKSIEMKYDYMGRRVQYISKIGTKLNKDRRFVYNGYTLTQELTNNNTMLKEFIWNPNAGIGSTPLVMKHANSGGLTLFYTQDANKNISELVFWSAQNGIGAHYEYSPFGEITTATKNTRVTTVDILAENPFRFSSEYFDSELGLVYYNYRHYNPQSGRWISRDPIEEKGGINLYNFVRNNSLNRIDILGMVGYVIGPYVKPKIDWDNGFKYDSTVTTSVSDYKKYLYYLTLLNGAELLGTLPDATAAYRHYLDGSGTDLAVNYSKAIKEDASIHDAIEGELNDATSSAEGLYQKGKNSYSIMGKNFLVGSSTENWQKALGGHQVWGFGSVSYDEKTCTFSLGLSITVEDFYNFNKGQLDIATGLPDNENGRFEVFGWAKSFYSRGAVAFSASWEKGKNPGWKINSTPAAVPNKR